MDPRIDRIRYKLARIPYEAQRSHSFGEEKHQFRRGPTATNQQVADLEQRLAVDLPEAYRDFLLHIEAWGVSPFYGIMPPDRCRLFTMNPPGLAPTGRGFTPANHLHRLGDLFLHIIEAGCSDLVLLGVTGPSTGRVMVGNAEGFWGPDLPSRRSDWRGARAAVQREADLHRAGEPPEAAPWHSVLGSPGAVTDNPATVNVSLTSAARASFSSGACGTNPPCVTAN